MLRLGDRDPPEPATLVPAIGIGALVLGLAMMTCFAPTIAFNLASPPPPPDVAAMPVDERPPPPDPRAIDVAAVLVFFLIGVVGTFGGVLGILRVRPGRQVLIAFGVLTLAYLTVTVGYRLTGGLEDLFASVPVDAPRGSALGAFFVWTVLPLVIVVVLVILSLRYLLRPDVALVFRRVRITPGDRAT